MDWETFSRLLDKRPDYTREAIEECKVGAEARLDSLIEGESVMLCALVWHVIDTLETEGFQVIPPGGASLLHNPQEVQHYVQRADHEEFEVPSGELYRIACCDCGLVHDVCLVSHDRKPIGFAARINHELTAERRRKIGADAL